MSYFVHGSNSSIGRVLLAILPGLGASQLAKQGDLLSAICNADGDLSKCSIGASCSSW